MERRAFNEVDSVKISSRKAELLSLQIMVKAKPDIFDMAASIWFWVRLPQIRDKSAQLSSNIAKNWRVQFPQDIRLNQATYGKIPKWSYHSHYLLLIWVQRYLVLNFKTFENQCGFSLWCGLYRSGMSLINSICLLSPSSVAPSWASRMIVIPSSASTIDVGSSYTSG